MLLGGDEFGRTQNGNNNAYCQDNELSWLSWQRSQERDTLFEFTRRLIQLRKDHPVFRRPRFLQGRRIRGAEVKDVMWFNPGGNEMSDEEWASPFVRCLGMLLSGDTADILNFEGAPIRDQTFLLLINAHYEPIQFVLPGLEHVEWELVLDTREEAGFLHQTKKHASGDDFDLDARSAALFQLTGGEQAQAREESWRKRPILLPEKITAEEERAGARKQSKVKQAEK